MTGRGCDICDLDTHSCDICTEVVITDTGAVVRAITEGES